MRYLTNLIILCCIFQITNAQSLPQIRFKAGGSILFPSPGGNNYAYRYSGAGESVVIGGEYSNPLKDKSGAWHVGFTFQDGQSNPFPYVKNVIPINTAPSGPGYGYNFLSAPSKTVIYGGFEKYLNRSATRPSKNYFSVIAGVGLGFTLNKLKDWEFTANQQYTTRDGRTINGFTSEYVRPNFPVALSLYSGLRYNITNKKGREVVIIELLANYGFTPYYRQNIHYTIDGTQHTDVLKERGLNAQLNIIVPLHTFKKKKSF